MGGDAVAFSQVGHQQLTVSTAAVALTMSPAGARPQHFVIYVGTSPIRWRADGTAPTATVGIYVAAGGYIDGMTGDNWTGWLNAVRFIRDTSAGADATLDIAYFA